MTANARRFVLVSHPVITVSNPSLRTPLRLQPIAWGTPDPLLAKNLGALLLAATPKFRFKGLRAALRPVTE